MSGGAPPSAGFAPYVRPHDLPDFEAPPVTQVAIALHFIAPQFRAVHAGLLWDRFRQRYPIVEEAPPIHTEVEDFRQHQTPLVQFQILNVPPVPLVSFVAADRTSLVQVQRDRFQCAWRQGEAADAYPHYGALRSDFIANAQVLSAFADEQGLGDLPIVQAEIIFTNDVPADRAFSDIVTMATPSSRASSAELPTPELVRAVQCYTFRSDEDLPYARLHVVAEPARSERGDVWRLTLAYRGEPFTGRQVNDPLASVVEFLDEGHDRIVRAFADATTGEMHTVWRRIK